MAEGNQNEKIEINGNIEQIDRVVDTEERLIKKYPDSEALIRATASFLKAYRRPLPTTPEIKEITDTIHD